MPFISIHLVMILGSLCLAWGLRYGWQKQGQSDSKRASWQARWQSALVCFVLPPLLVVMTAIAVLCMGTQGKMMGWQVGQISYAIAAIFLIYCLVRSLQLAYSGWLSLQKLQNLVVETQTIRAVHETNEIRLLDLPLLFAAQIGFWRSHLFVSQGLLDSLDRDHLEAVLLHERAHAHYRDTFWFFWLGCLRQVMPWLPSTQFLWEELLLLRELRADRWASESVDGLLLAESLLAMVSSDLCLTETFAAAFGATNVSDRLEERINFLLAEPEPLPQFSWQSFLWIGLCLIPLTLLPLHY